eukprot:SAG31_NODE_13024_length_899_cov_0.927500_1_plen_224_part_10
MPIQTLKHGCAGGYLQKDPRPVCLKTPVKESGGRNPKWRYTAQIPFADMDGLDTVLIEVYDKEATADDFVGMAKPLSLSALLADSKLQQYTLSGLKGLKGKNGKVSVSFCLRDPEDGVEAEKAEQEQLLHSLHHEEAEIYTRLQGYRARQKSPRGRISPRKNQVRPAIYLYIYLYVCLYVVVYIVYISIYKYICVAHIYSSILLMRRPRYLQWMRRWIGCPCLY